MRNKVNCVKYYGTGGVLKKEKIYTRERTTPKSLKSKKKKKKGKRKG